MQRRSFLKRLFGVATAVIVSENVIPDDGVALKSIAHPFNPDLPSGAVGFGMAPAKAEGSVMLYDELDCRPGGIMTSADFRAQLKEGLETVFRLQYKDYPEDFAEFAEKKTRSELDHVKLIG